MNETAKKKVNYSVSEKSLLLSIVQRFKNVVENKKTDAVTWREKDSAWEKIAEIFSSKSTGVLRTKDSLRKLYENLKKNVRKQVVDEKKLLICTGGGPPPAKKPKAENDLKEQILSIVNSKTVYGLPSIFDGDAVKENRDKSPQPGCSKDFYQLDTDHDYFSFDNENEVIVVETSTPRKGILVNTDQNTEPQNNKYQKHESCQKFAATTNEDSIIMEKSSKDINIFKTKKDDALHVDSHVDGCSA
ncbi:unnamed protein product [Ceutorhynchus assimilis]|uniref:Regulatory protein zeste n=1 Tax=Ceutorhynchus assimilis TaxID=467358 RepID=A0A9N9QQH8_9CUCU|nr:unnamed protein product [Ceutorhynchus assimilis]